MRKIVLAHTSWWRCDDSLYTAAMYGVDHALRPVLRHYSVNGIHAIHTALTVYGGIRGAFYRVSRPWRRAEPRYA